MRKYGTVAALLVVVAVSVCGVSLASGKSDVLQKRAAAANQY